MDFHVVVCRQSNLQDAHRVADHLEKEVAQALGNAHVVSHIDPCGLECPGKDRRLRVLDEIRKFKDPEADQGAREDEEKV